MTDKIFRDSTGRSLTDYPRPSVAVDTVLLSPDPEQGLVVLQVRRTDATGWALPGTFLYEGERLADAVKRSLLDKAGVRGLHPHQVHVFDDPNRDARGWVLSVAHVEVVPAERLASRKATDTRLVPVDRPVRLPYGHGGIIARAVNDIRSRYEREPDPDQLLGDEFTLHELRLTHESIACHPLQRDKFRRTMEPQLIPTGTPTAGTRGRPAELFRRREVPEPRRRRRE
jgi:8-oxo-dGTP diphosphatase